MAYPDETKTKLRLAYVRAKLPLTEAAKQAGVSAAAAKKWKAAAKTQGDDWDTARAASRLAQGGLGELTTEVLEEFILQFKLATDALRSDLNISAMARAETLARLSDSYIKTAKAASSANSSLARLAVALEVLELLGQFIQTHYPRHTGVFVEVLEPFGAELGKQYG